MILVRLLNSASLKRLLFSLFLLLTLCSPSFAAAETRVIRVGVAVTRLFQQESGWKETFQRRLEYASKIFERSFKLKFKVVQYWQWNPPADRQDTNYLMEDLIAAFPLKKDFDIVIGLTRLTDRKLLDNLSDFDTLGIARPFSGYLMLRYPLTPLFKIQQETVLTHELGHVFGATHTNAPDTVMSPIVRYQIPTEFDMENREIISLTRKMDFRKGLESLSPADVQRLLGSYLKLMQFDQRFDFYYSLGVFYLRLGQTDDTLKAWEKAAELDPENPRIYYDLGVLYMKRGQQDLAVQKLGLAARKLSHPSLSDLKAEALTYLGSAYFQKGSVDSAYQAWSKASALRQKDENLKGNLALVQLMMGKTNEAIRMLEEVVQKNPKNAKGLANLGYAYYQKGDYSQAILYLAKALKLVPNQTMRGNIGPMDPAQPSEIHKQLGQVYFKINDKKRAMEHFQDSCRHNPSVECRKNLGYMYYETGDYPKAISALTGVLPQSLEDPQIYGILGVSFSRTKDDGNAVSIFQEGLKHINDKKTVSLFHKNIGNIYVQNQQWDAAVREFQLAIVNDWNNLDSHFGLAMAYLGQGRPMEARQSLANLLRMNPGNEEAKKLLTKIDKALESQR